MNFTTLATALRALSFVPSDERDVWVRMGMALKSEFGDDAYVGWCEWSANASSYSASACKSSWRSFKNGGGVGIGSLFDAAKSFGFVFNADEVEISPAEIAERQAARAKREAEAELKRKSAAEAAAKRAASQWRMAAKAGESAYLLRKKVTGEAIRYLDDGSIILPMMRYDATPPHMVGKQVIAADGSKKFSSGMDKTGAMLRLGDVPAGGDVIYFAEGYATAASVRMALGYSCAVFVCFDAGMLLAGASIARSLFPDSRFIFCADDDYLTGNVGRAKAQAAADAVGNAVVLVPLFDVSRRAVKTDDSLPHLTDFNDLHCAQGISAVHDQLRAALLIDDSPAPSALTDKNSDGDPRTPDIGSAKVAVLPGSLDSLLQHFALVYGKTDVWDSLNKQLIKKAAFADFAGSLAKEWLAHPKRRTIPSQDLPILKNGRAISSRSGGEGDDFAQMFERYVLLYGTETVWDRQSRKVISLAALRASAPDLAPRWLESTKRRMIDADNLVFDPTQQADPDTHINMFTGYPLVPLKNDDLAMLCLDLLESLCSTESNGAECFDWILKWLAYPLQHPGAKMDTALLMFGEKQGTGKSLFFDGIMRPIYGEYGTTAGQHQLESNFTDWRSRKTFVLFEEVLGRAERHNYIGTIKHMVTGKDMRINPKGLPERVEANHLNSVFLSNERQPLPLDKEDRRFMVVEALAHMPPEFYAKFKGALAAGASAAFYQFLLTYPLGDFNEHTKPLRTDSKDAVINFGLPSWDVFYQYWREGELDAPYCTCLTKELHRVFVKWCDSANEKKLSETKFCELISGRELKTRKRVKTSVAKREMRTILLIGDESTIDEDIQTFRNLAGIRGGDLENVE